MLESLNMQPEEMDTIIISDNGGVPQCSAPFTKESVWNLTINTSFYGLLNTYPWRATQLTVMKWDFKSEGAFYPARPQWCLRRVKELQVESQPWIWAFLIMKKMPFCFMLLEGPHTFTLWYIRLSLLLPLQWSEMWVSWIATCHAWTW